MIYKVLCRLKELKGLTDDFKIKIDIFFATSRITEEQYNELMDIEGDLNEKSLTENNKAD